MLQKVKWKSVSMYKNSNIRSEMNINIKYLNILNVRKIRRESNGISAPKARSRISTPGVESLNIKVRKGKNMREEIPMSENKSKCKSLREKIQESRNLVAREMSHHSLGLFHLENEGNVVRIFNMDKRYWGVMLGVKRIIYLLNIPMILLSPIFPIYYASGYLFWSIIALFPLILYGSIGVVFNYTLFRNIVLQIDYDVDEMKFLFKMINKLGRVYVEELDPMDIVTVDVRIESLLAPYGNIHSRIRYSTQCRPKWALKPLFDALIHPGLQHWGEEK